MLDEDKPLSGYRRLVDRYVDLSSWTTAKKTALITLLLAPAQLATAAVMYEFASRDTAGLDYSQLEPMLWPWTVAVSAICLVACLAVASRREGRWTAYLLVTVQIPFMTWLYHLLGTVSNPILAWYPLAVVLMSLFFDQKVGAYCLVYSTLALLTVGGLELAGILPYAPAVVDRTLESQVNLYQYVGKFMMVMVIFAFVFSMLQLSSTARSIQEERLAEANRKLDDSNRLLERGAELISRYVPPQLAARLLGGEHDYGERPERRKLTIFFSDIEGFTPLAEEMEPEDLTALLNEYLTEMSIIIDAFGGTLTQFVGDGIMVIFGAPNHAADNENAAGAVGMALAMQRRMVELQEKWFVEGIETTFDVRMGINTGMANVGNFGSRGRMTYCAIGTQTNLASRIQSQCEAGKVLISHSTWGLVKDSVEWLSKGKLQVKGVHHPVQVYEVVDEARPTQG